MRFVDLNTRMRVFEAAHDLSVLPRIYTAARLAGGASRS